MRSAVIILAAGSGSRTGMKTPKPFIKAGGLPLVLHSLRAFQRHRSIHLIQPVLPARLFPLFRRTIQTRHALGKCRAPAKGGRERQASVFSGLRRLPREIDIVVVHDAARPFVSSSMITTVIAAASRTGAALAAVPVQDTLKRADRSGLVKATVDRSSLWQAQTPQAFSRDLFLEAHERALSDGHLGTDDASLVERLGAPVEIVPGSSRNIKVTTRDDIALARALLRGN